MACYANNVCGSISKDKEGMGGGREASKTCCEPGPKEVWVGRSSVLSTSQSLKYFSQTGKEALGHSCLVEARLCITGLYYSSVPDCKSPAVPALIGTWWRRSLMSPVVGHLSSS